MPTKCVWTLNIGGYAPEITAITYPGLQDYASKIGADFRIISERHWPDAPATYEKLQLHWLGEEYDWNIYIDSDALIHPDLFDITRHIHKNTVFQTGRDLASTRWKDNAYFRRDGRFISACNWFTIASNDCLDLWRPLEGTNFDEVLANIRPHSVERATCSDGHLIDDYVLSCNIARYGLKYVTFKDLCAHLKVEHSQVFFHSHLLTLEEKKKVLPAVLELWNKHQELTPESLAKILETAQVS